MDKKENLKIATLGGGCFWCLEPIFKKLEGVEKVVVGYAGGNVPDPSYELVCTGSTNHAEVIQVHYDPETISYRELLEVFFSTHDPTTPNRQGADVGTQYRSIILYHDDQQKEDAETYLAELDRSGQYKAPIVTQLLPYEVFYEAESYHQAYFEKNPYAGYCQMVIKPKVEKFKKEYKEQLKN